MTAHRKVSGVGMNINAWKYPDISCVVCKYSMTPGALCFIYGMIGLDIGYNGMFHITFYWLL